MGLSIIIPTRNEAVALPETLACLAALNPQPQEVIVVDGQSQDATVEIAEAAGVKLLRAPSFGRAEQMNAGAAAASGDVLCFLHADTCPPPDFVDLATTTLRDPHTALAGFVSIMRGPQKIRWVTTAHNYLKTWYAPLLFRPLSFLRGCRLLFGDQVMVCRAHDFHAIGGFDVRQVIMEEADLCLRMVRAGRGRVRQIHRLVHSSDRRVAQWGEFKANMLYLYIGAMWGFGAKPAYLINHYEDVR